MDTSGNRGWRGGLHHDSIRLLELKSEALMAGEQPGFWDVEHRLRELSEHGDPLEKLAATVDFEIFRAELMAALKAHDPAKGGRPGFDLVLKFRMDTPDNRLSSGA